MEANCPKVSIITVTLNCELTIRETVESVLKQSYKNIEHIIVDGLSSDKTLDIVEEYRPQYCGRLKIISEQDSGIYDAMNKGVKLSSGVYVYFLNSGDYFYDQNVLRFLEQYFSDDYDLIIGTVIRIYKGYCVNIEGDLEKLHIGKMPPHQGSFIRRSIFEALNGYNVKYRSSGDIDFFCKLYFSKHSYIKINNIIAYMPSGGMSSNKSISVNESFMVISRYYGKYHAYIYYLNKMILEQGIKRILLFLGLRGLYEKLLKVKLLHIE